LPPPAGHFTFREAAQQLLLHFDEDVPQPTAALYLEFNYNLKEGLSGFYRCGASAGRADECQLMH
jgi:hypothetical protein